MSWTSMLEKWETLMHDFAARFPYCDSAALKRFRGNRSLLVTYLAETHELTNSEAAETLADWLAHSAAQVPQRAAA